MKKLFTLVALLTFFMGAKAEWVEDYKIDYSTYTGFPFYVMGYVPEWFDGVMTDFGANYKYVAVEGAEETSDVIVETSSSVQYYKIELAEPAWHQYFIADGIPTELDGSYTVKAMVKASEACNIVVNMGWGWGDGQTASAQVSIGTEWEEVEWQYSGIGGTSCNLVAQPGTVTATIEWKSLTVSHNEKPKRPVQWQEWLTSDGQPVLVTTTPADIPTWMGNAETPWADPNVKFDDQDNNYLVCAWSKEKGRNLNDDSGWDPFPADIEEVDGSHVFVCHGQTADTEGDASAWDNQFWIQSPRSWKSGTQVKVSFRYKASQDGVKTNTQFHKQNPSDYLIWHAIGDITFSKEWQTFEGTMTIGDDMDGGWSIAFNLNAEVKDPVNFYFDDLSWQTMKLDEGLFVAASNATTGIEYDFDNAIQFEFDEDIEAYVAVVGEMGKQDTWVNEVMISTTRGNDAAFKSSTLKPSGEYIGEDAWGNYTESSLAKIKLPAAGVWQIAIDTEEKQLNFIKLEGEEDKEPIIINPNPTVVIVNGQERDWLTADGEGNAREAEIGTGEAWDNQFFIVANRTLEAGEETVLSFEYMSSVEAKTTTQCHGEPGAYIHWGAIGDVNFAGDWQTFDITFTVPSAAAGMKSIAFNMAEIKEACVYQIKNIVWKLADGSESLINQEGSENFYVKEGAGTTPYIFGTDPEGISSVVANSSASNITYNLAGQRVSKEYKGIVVKNGRKNIAK